MRKPDLAERVRRYADSSGLPDTPTMTDIPGLAIVRCRRRTPIEPLLYRSLVAVVLQGTKETLLGETRTTYSTGQSLVVCLDVPAVSRVTEASPERPYLALSLMVRPSIVAELHAEVGGPGIDEGAERVIDAGAADEELFDAFGRLFDLLGEPARQRVLVPLLEREIHYRTLLAGHAGMLRRLARTDGPVHQVALALHHIRDRFPETVRVEELARLAGMSESTFHEHFKEATRTTPRQYQKDLRLLEGRQRLLAGSASVSEVAFDVGYASATHFSRDYSRRFGHPPREARRGTVATPDPPTPDVPPLR